MKVKNIVKSLFAAAVTLGVAACADTDAQYEVVIPDNPNFVATYPAANGSVNKNYNGDMTVTVKFDKRINFKSADYSKIASTGCVVDRALVYGADSTLSIHISGLTRGANCSLTIPAGLIKGANGTDYDEDVVLNFSVKDIPATPVAATTPSAQNLYTFLRDNFEKKIISGAMANVAWNTDVAENIYAMTGKYPAINGFDYVHLASSPSNWIDYGDITPVKNWADNGGIVTLMWHWNVPVEEGSSTMLFYKENDGVANNFKLDSAVVEGTWENEVVKADLAKVGGYLKLLQDADIPVIWRPLHEAAGGWFWWGDNAESFKKLWIMMYDSFKAQGINNLIWVWTSEIGDDDWYPGAEYVDIVGRDIYGKTAENCLGDYQRLVDTYSDKIIALTECGQSNDVEIATITAQWAEGARWGWFMPWYDADGATTSHGSLDWWTDAMNSPLVITRDDVSF